RVRDATELLAAAGPKPGAPIRRTVAIDHPCHLLHAQRVAEPPLRVLAAIPELEVTVLPDADRCCGGAGIYNLLEPRLSRAVLAPKLDGIEATKAQLVATANPGCHLHIGAGLLRRNAPARCVHPVTLLDASYAAAHAGRHWREASTNSRTAQGG
ncbi:MAG TPA: (Fe-S)-binding protein, partial [Gemmatimonadaceae bacterium]